MPSLLKQKQQAREWFGLTPQERCDQKLPFNEQELAELLGIKKVKTIRDWRVEWKKLEQAKQEPNGAIPSYDSVEWLTGRTSQMDEALTKACQMGNAQALKLYYQITNRLIEKSEQKVQLELNADEIATQYIENRKWLREHGYLAENGMGQVLPEPALLPENIREDKR